MTELDKYTMAVATRKSHDVARGKVNVAILMQLESHDVPLLLEIIRVQDFALKKVKEAADDDSDEFSFANLALAKTEELAKTGSSAKWGDEHGH